ncbi:hypothetical protein B0J11DRAFT_434694 [Dendryphion nanum]|uniref:Uncharacterized protein n=1 Tax=Dendryphion nanum TaxID=256645 RepID=A0A9P9DTU5_9PLEO|nr:hypothetical protein B0J11DRAFT_434694 [Dendryphion nanum]
MMLSASPFHAPSFYTPHMPSPLAERSANVIPRTFTFTMASQTKADKTPIPKRAHKPNPAILSRDAQAQRRRDLFHRKVQNEREERKWETRGEQLERLDFFSDQKRWETAKARQAPKEFDVLDDDLLEEFATAQQSTNLPQLEPEMSEADWVLAQEEQELQELIAAMEAQEQNEDVASQHYGSDDEDYDDIFMECMNNANFAQPNQTANSDYDMDAMDLTDG